MKFGDDWSGLFLRGDAAINFAHHLERLLELTKGIQQAELIISRHVIVGLVSDLKSVDESKGPSKECQQLKAFDECRIAPKDPIVVPRNIRNLVTWRDTCALDWTGDDLVSHIVYALTNWRLIDVPEEHRGALPDFQALSEDVQYEMVKEVLISNKSY